MRTRTRIATACVAAAGITLAFSGQASAATTGTASCSTTGARGSVGVTYPTGEIAPYLEHKLAMSVSDTSADGHHVRIRFISKPVGNTGTTYWKWHSLTSGSGTSLTFSTTAQSSYGIAQAGVQVARFEGNTLLNSCTAWD